MSTIKYDPSDPNPLRLHLQARRGDIGEYVIVPGDPFRCDLVASFFDESKLISHNREIKIYTGSYKGLSVSVCSTGMGCPSAAIVCEELAQIGAKVLLRTGSGFLLRDDIKEGDIAVTLGSAKYEGTTEFFVPKGYPAIADLDLVTALVKTARKYVEGTDAKVHTGITATVDGFYGETPEFLQKLKDINIMNIEMESSAVITTCQRYGIRGGCICTCGSDDTAKEARKLYESSMERQIRIALDSFVELDRMEKAGEVINIL
ncbi:MAG: nucleoside phosphorylase [Ruminococcaceae bacterium]|nr:nucleoside phosphorylase [Oscillospiraceae bacterium]